jgi:CheY-like chemotaxis protein
VDYRSASSQPSAPSIGLLRHQPVAPLGRRRHSAPKACNQDVCHVLVVHGDAWVRRIIFDVLTAEGWTTRRASNGWSALRLAMDLWPRVVLVAPQLSEVSTQELVDALEADVRTRGTAVVRLDLVQLTQSAFRACFSTNLSTVGFDISRRRDTVRTGTRV